MFKRYLGWELVKQLKSKKNIALFCLLIFGLLGYFVYSYQMSGDDLRRRIEFYDGELNNIAFLSMRFGEMLSLTPGQAAVLSLVQNENLHVRQARNFAGHFDRPEGHLFPVLTGERWHEELGARILAYEAVLAGVYGFINARIIEQYDLAREHNIELAFAQRGFDDHTLPLRYRAHTEESLKSSIISLRYVYNTEMRPVFSEYDATAWQFLYRIITNIAPLLIPVFAVFLSADVLSGEKEAGSYKFLLLQPLSRVKVYMGKVLSAYILCAGALLGAFVLMFTVSGIVGGFGESGYPVRFGDLSAYEVINHENFTETMYILDPGTTMPEGFIAVSGFMLRSVPLLLLAILFIVSLVVFVSFTAENNLSAYSISLTIVLGSAIIQMFLPDVGMVWNPLAYSDIAAIAAGGLLPFIWYPFVWAAALLAAGMLHFRKKDIIC